MKIVRELKELGSELGLECLGLETRSRHFKLIFKRGDGESYAVTLSMTKDDPHRRAVLSMEKALKRFAAGKAMFQ